MGLLLVLCLPSAEVTAPDQKCARSWTIEAHRQSLVTLTRITTQTFLIQVVLKVALLPLNPLWLQRLKHAMQDLRHLLQLAPRDCGNGRMSLQ